MTHSRDILIGKRIRQRRRERGLSQKMVAARLGISYQQVQKYEHAQSRVAASTLADIAAFLDTEISYFFYETITPHSDRAEGGAIQAQQ